LIKISAKILRGVLHPAHQVLKSAGIERCVGGGGSYGGAGGGSGARSRVCFGVGCSAGMGDVLERTGLRV
jgi:hypothetical protein